MDITLYWSIYCYTLLAFFQIVSLSYIDSPLYRRKASKRALLYCTLKCPHGYDTDIEGNPFCRCSDVCANISCPGSLSCVVTPRKRCRKGSCKPRAHCKDLTRRPGKGILNNNIQSDGAVKTNVCSMELQKSAFECKRKRRRWYFDEKTGLCVKFKGCDGEGNNFPRKKLCKKQCIKKKKRPRKNRKRTRKNKSKNRPVHMESRTPEITEIQIPISHPPRLFSAFSAPGVYYTARCPADKPKVQCPHNPCSSCTDFYVLCEINLCGKCSANYYHRKTGHPLTRCSIW